ncbi:MAG: hypothetical protein HC822_26165 [Oscillochloris sp.]|nr:hypothetical protein [Oscillochloris sp.]
MINNLGYVAERRSNFQQAYEDYSATAQMKRDPGDLAGLALQWNRAWCRWGDRLFGSDVRTKRAIPHLDPA